MAQSFQQLVASFEATPVDQLIAAGRSPFFGATGPNGKQAYYVHPKMGSTIFMGASKRTDVVKNDYALWKTACTKAIAKMFPKAAIPADPKQWVSLIRKGAISHPGIATPLAMMYAGVAPFEKFTDQSGKKWVKVYDIDDDSYEFTDEATWRAKNKTKKNVVSVAFNAVGDFLSSIGRVIAKGARWVWRALKDVVNFIKDLFCKVTDTALGQATAMATLAAMGVPPQAGQTATQLAKNVFCAQSAPAGGAPGVAATAGSPPWLWPALIGGGVLVFVLMKN